MKDNTVFPITNQILVTSKFLTQRIGLLKKIKIINGFSESCEFSLLKKLEDKKLKDDDSESEDENIKLDDLEDEIGKIEIKYPNDIIIKINKIILIEIKTLVGEDYPCFMRKMKTQMRLFKFNRE
mgnify:CR=1 FL=1